MVSMWESNSLAEDGHMLVAANSTSSNHHLTGRPPWAHHWFPQT